MEQNSKNMDPPPPYTATDFNEINAPRAGPPPAAGFVIPPPNQPQQTGKKIIACLFV